MTRLILCLVLCLGGLFFLVSCTSESVFQENDVARINRIMADFLGAVRERDEVAFIALEAGKSPSDWPALLKFVQSNSAQAEVIFAEPLVLDRSLTTAHISELRIETFFDFSEPNDKIDRSYFLKWHFVRDAQDDQDGEDGQDGQDEQWALAKVSAGRTGRDYNNMISDLSRMSELSFEALYMQGAPIDSLPELLGRTYLALRGENTDALNLLTVDGVLFRALERGVAMPTLDNSKVLGDYNRSLARDAWAHQFRNLQNFSTPLNMTEDELLTYFQAFSPEIFPPGGTALRLTMEFADEGVAETIDSFKLTWTAAFLHGQWLVDEMGIYRVSTTSP